MKKKAQIDFSEINPMSLAAGAVCGFIVMIMMGFTGKVQIGLVWKILGLIGGFIAGYLVFNTILNK